MGLTSRFQKFLTTPLTHTSKSPVIFWFSLSLTISAIYAFLAIQKAFSADYVIQDDARQHIFWMQRFLDPQLFPK
jgi:thiamine pyrophosphate-dependent acetolactate synthase large subunit-like protein